MNVAISLAGDSSLQKNPITTTSSSVPVFGSNSATLTSDDTNDCRSPCSTPSLICENFIVIHPAAD